MSAPPGCKDECGVGSNSPSFTKPFTACENPFEKVNASTCHRDSKVPS